MLSLIPSFTYFKGSLLHLLHIWTKIENSGYSAFKSASKICQRNSSPSEGKQTNDKDYTLYFELSFELL